MSQAPLRTLRILASMMARDISITLTYRGWVALLQVANLTTPVVSLVVWRGAVAQGAMPPVSVDFLTTWFVMVSLVTIATSSWTAHFLADSIRTGGLASWLVRPGSPHLLSIANNLGEKLIKLLLALPVVVVLVLIFHQHLTLPTNPVTWLAFSLSIMLASAMTLALDIVIGSLAFWFDDVTGFTTFTGLVTRVLSGAVVPLALFPTSAQRFLELQPFRYQVSFSLEILTAQANVASGLLVASAWTAAATLLAAAVWRTGLRRYEGAGA